MTRRTPLRYLIVGAIAVGIVVTVYLTSGEQARERTAIGTQSQELERQSESPASGTPTREDLRGTSLAVSADVPEGLSDTTLAESLSSRNQPTNDANLGGKSQLSDSDRFSTIPESTEEDVYEATVDTEAESVSELPCWRLTSNLPENYYAVSQDQEEAFSGESSARIFSTSSNAQFGTLSQTISAGAFAGQRVEFSAFLKFQNVSRGVSLWVYATNAAGAITVSQRLDWIPGTFDWHSRSITVDVPPESVALTYAFNITGEGTLWVDDARIATVSEAVAVTSPDLTLPNGRGGSMPAPDAGELPVSVWNADFEAWDADEQPCAAEAP